MLEVNAIDLHYGAAQALRGVSLKAEPGKVTCVLGRNGVGKTSLLRAIAGQHAISKGSIVLGEEDISKLRPYQRARRGVAIVPQGREIFPLLTVEENLETGFAPLRRDERNIPNDVFSLFPVLNSMPPRRRSMLLSTGKSENTSLGMLRSSRRSGAKPVSRFSSTVSSGKISRPCGTIATPRRAR